MKSRRRAAVLATAVVLIGLAVAVTRGHWRWSPGASRVRSIAVLPFENLGGDPGQEYFVDGMTDAVTADLAQVSALRVISRSSVVPYKKTRKPRPAIVDELDVDAIVEGAVVRVGDRVRVTARLIAADTDEPVWARDYERERRDVLTLQREVAGAIAEAVGVQLAPSGQRRLDAAIDPAVYEAWLEGRFYSASPSPEGTLEAEHFFQEAIAKDPKYAPAYSGLSDTYRQFGLRGLPPREYMPRAEAAARQALALDDTLAEAHASLADVLYRYQWDWEGAEREFRRSLDLDPRSAEAHRAYGIYLMAVRRDEEALVQMRRAAELSPRSPVINVELGLALTRNRRYADAMQRLEKAMEIEPSWRVYATMAMTYEAQGDWEKAIPLLEQANSLGSPDCMPWLGYAYGVAGRRREALALVSQMETLARTHYISPQNVAFVHLGLGDKDRALAGLEKAYQERAFEVLGFAGDVFDRLHDDPRFQDLLQRMNMTAAIGRRPG